MESGTHAEVLSRLSIIIRGVGKHKSSNLSTKGLIIQLSEKKSMCHQLYTNLQLIDLQRKEHLRGR